MSRHLVRAALMSVALPAIAAAQIVRGTVSARSGTLGVPGVVVLLLDSAGVTVGRALTDAAGEYRIAAPGAGTYRLRTMRVGFRPDTSAAITLGVGQEREMALAIANVAVHLDTVRVAERSQCRVDGADATAAVWDQARTALLAAQMTARLRSVKATIMTYDRTLDPNSERVREQQSGMLSGLTVRPWTSLPPDSLRKVGYVTTDRDGAISYLAPDLDALLSPNFVADHCFKVVRTRDTTVLGVAFEPGRDRAKISGIAGTLWLDRASADLKRLEFTYANVPREQSERAGGDMEFARMSNGGYAISRWAIKMPVWERQMAAGRQLDRIAELRAVGGELSYALNGNDTLYARAPLSLTGTVEDSVTRYPVKGAKVAISGGSLDTVFTDEKGRFSIPRMLSGEYTLEIRTPTFEAINASVRWPVMFVDAKTQPVIRLPSADQIIAARTAVFAGVVVDSAMRPLAGVDVTLPGLEVMAITDAKGAFRLSQIPPGTHEVSVRKIGYGPLHTSLAFAPARAVDRKVVLTKLTVLDTVIVEASSDMAEFEANKKLGLGHFMTRDQLEKLSGRPLASALSEVKGVGIVTARGSHGYLQSTHATNSFSTQVGINSVVTKVTREKNTLALLKEGGYIPSHIYCPETAGELSNQGVKCGCYSKVWVDKMLMNPEEPTHPFDVNTIPPEDIEAIELYMNPAQTPLKYQARNASCGVMVIHRRRYTKDAARK